MIMIERARMINEGEPCCKDLWFQNTPTMDASLFLKLLICPQIHNLQVTPLVWREV